MAFGKRSIGFRNPSIAFCEPSMGLDVPSMAFNGREMGFGNPSMACKGIVDRFRKAFLGIPSAIDGPRSLARRAQCETNGARNAFSSPRTAGRRCPEGG